MNGRKAISISLFVVLFAGLAFISQVSAYSITDGVVSYDSGTGETTWTFDVTCAGDPYDISHFTVAWCNKDAVKEVWVGTVDLTDKFEDDPGWDYGDYEGVHGIKIDYQVDKGTTVSVTIILAGNYKNDPNNVAYVIKASGLYPSGSLNGPVAACNEIPEFSTIAIPVAAIFGLLFFFNHRKHRKELK